MFWGKCKNKRRTRLSFVGTSKIAFLHSFSSRWQIKFFHFSIELRHHVNEIWLLLAPLNYKDENKWNPTPRRQRVTLSTYRWQTRRPCFFSPGCRLLLTFTKKTRWNAAVPFGVCTHRVICSVAGLLVGENTWMILQGENVPRRTEWHICPHSA